MKAYDVIFFDLDNTLLDYKNAETNVMIKLFEQEGKSCPDMTLKKLWNRSSYYWEKYGMENTESPYIQENYHTLFYNYLTDFMREVGADYHFRAPERLPELFLEYLSQEQEMLEGVEEVLCHLQKKAALILASNGIRRVQSRRVGKLAPYFKDIIISEDVGVVKPGKRFWDCALARAGTAPQNCLMVGDSLKNDIQGAAACGMDTCWVNWKGKMAEGGECATYVIGGVGEMIQSFS